MQSQWLSLELCQPHLVAHEATRTQKTQTAMQIEHQVRLGDLISACGALIASTALLLNYWQLRVGSIRKRAEFIVSTFNQYITDPESSEALYEIEYNKFDYGDDFHGSKKERQLDRLLTYFEKISALYEMRTIKLSDLELVRYDFLRAFNNSNVQQYFKTLDAQPRGGNFMRFRGVAQLLSETK
jgi:hypothetical protein